ncbi:MAG: translation elongation factor Ts [Christensenellaceae bacterium]|jgi:elongation factor Ts|nr:translation elongation factor Ts [Christensenellaceae bacterium]
MAISTKDVSDLRTQTGAGMMDCKKALEEANGVIERAVEILREKGKAASAKKAGRIASQGIVDSYIHLNGKIGVLIEVNCETDFVAGSAEFKEFVHELALQIAASKPTYISIEDVPQDVVTKEESIFRAIADNEKGSKPKPKEIADKVLQGRMNNFYREVCLLEQVYVRDNTKTIKGLLAELTSKIGEKIVIRRFICYQMGEGLQKKVDNFAEEINAQVAKMKEANKD